MRRKLVMTALVVSLVVLCGCEKKDFVRNSWVTIRDADAAVEQMTGKWEAWRKLDPALFTPTELARLQQALQVANDAVQAATESLEAYQRLEAAVKAGQAQPADLVKLEAETRAFLGNVERLVAVARDIFGVLAPRASPPQQAVFPILPFLVVLTNLLGQFLKAILEGKAGEVTATAMELVSVVLAAHQEATGEEITEEKFAAIRARCEARRLRLRAGESE